MVEPVELLGYILISNPIRKEAKSTFEYFDRQGVNIKVISGDNPLTVARVAKQAGIRDADKLIDATEIGEGDYEEVVKKYKPFIEHFKRMEELARILKNRREKQGSLNLDLPETKIVLDENGFAIDVKKYEISFANEIIEQFMLTANETVAARF